MKKRKPMIALAVAGAVAISLPGCTGTKTKVSLEETETTGQTEGDGETTKASQEETEGALKSENTGKEVDFKEKTEALYEGKIFDASYVHEINIEISEEDWADLKANPTKKTKYETTVTIDGETLSSVSFATKGNSSLSQVASDPSTDRYSFKLNFGKFSDGQTYYGLDKLNLNNILSDATYMKDYLSYHIFEAAGADAPLTSYVHLSINGESFGLYLAVEEVGEAFLTRTENEEGQLYKPDTEQMNMDGKGGAGGNFPGFDGQLPEGMTMPDGMNFPGFDGQLPEGMTMPDGMNFPGFDGQLPEGMTMPDGTNFPEQNGEENKENQNTQDGRQWGRNGQRQEGQEGFAGRNGRGFGDSKNGAALAYTDDLLESYSDIFDNAETKPTDDDKKRLVNALKELSEGENLSDCLDTEAIIRYFAAHNFVLNYDSYTGNMLHNYYLYEEEGKLSLFPWDYNLAFGGFGGFGAGNTSGATSLINTGIDTPLSGTTEDARPMWAWIVQNEEYLAQYHQVYEELLENYFENNAYAEEIERVYEMIRPYVESDPTAFYTVEDFDKACEALKTFCKLRSESIRKQLDGTLSKDTTAQKTEDQVDAKDLVISDMGSQGGGRGMNSRGENTQQREDQRGNQREDQRNNQREDQRNDQNK